VLRHIVRVSKAKLSLNIFLVVFQSVDIVGILFSFSTLNYSVLWEVSLPGPMLDILATSGQIN